MVSVNMASCIHTFVRYTPTLTSLAMWLCLYQQMWCKQSLVHWGLYSLLLLREAGYHMKKAGLACWRHTAQLKISTNYKTHKWDFRHLALGEPPDDYSHMCDPGHRVTNCLVSLESDRAHSVLKLKRLRQTKMRCSFYLGETSRRTIQWSFV